MKNDGGCEILWVPLHWVGRWSEFKTTRNHITVSILLPSGVATYDSEHVRTTLEDGETVFVVECDWPALMQTKELLELHSRWKGNARDTNFTLMLHGMDAAMKKIKKTSGGNIKSIFRLTLDFKVMMTYDRKWIQNGEDCRLLYVDFTEAPVELDDESNNNEIEVFETVDND